MGVRPQWCASSSEARGSARHGLEFDPHGSAGLRTFEIARAKGDETTARRHREAGGTAGVDVGDRHGIDPRISAAGEVEVVCAREGDARWGRQRCGWRRRRRRWRGAHGR
eukprot:2555573-Prymnesium_polylepis.2